MRYPNIRLGRFIQRPNRFIAYVDVDGGTQTCHVKNTGRCQELLIPGAAVAVQYVPSPARRTAYDLIAVQKGDRLINMDSSAPNKAFAEWARAGRFLPALTQLKAEVVHGDSRFDFYMETAQKRVFVEVKGVTLEENGVVRFPDAPTLRGVKHLRGLSQCVEEGYEAWALFVIQMEKVERLEPNRKTHPEFADALKAAKAAGVRLLALDCHVSWDELTVNQPVPVRLV